MANSTTGINATSAVGTSGIDVNALVSQLMTVEQQPITKLAAREASYQAKLSAFGTLQGAVASFQSTVRTLSNASSFQAVTATSSDTATISATALTSALPGSYSLEVTSLAQAQKLAAAGQNSVSAAIGTGASTTLSFDFGTIAGTLTNGIYNPGATFSSNGSGVKTVTINGSNNSLQGMRDAINAAKIGVTASIINDGGASPYRLVLSSDSLGRASSMKISASGDATLSALLANDPAGTQNLSESVTASNADLKVNGVAVSKNSNTISDVIPGVTLNLTKITTAPVTLSVAQDSAAAGKAVNSFVTAYNSLSKTLADLSSYNAATKKGAALQGDATVRNLQGKLRGILNTSIAGSGSLTSLSQIGVTFQKDGTLSVDNARLNSVMQSNFADVAGLFASTGRASDSLVSFNTAGSSTKPGSYSLNITQIATQGYVTGSAAPPSLTIDATNDTLDMSVNGVAASVTLTSGTYATALELATEVQSRLNSATALSGVGIAVTARLDAGRIVITSNSYGASSSVTVAGGNGAANLFGTATSTAGLDVNGTVDGVSATGNGQLLTAGGDAQGLSVLVNGGALGARGTVGYSQGYAYFLNKLSTSVLASDGQLTASTNEINNSIKDIGTRRAVLQQRLTGIEARYRSQFTALDGMLSSMNTTSTFLTQQLARM